MALSHGALNVAKNDSLVTEIIIARCAKLKLRDYLLDLFNQNQHKPKEEQITPKMWWSQADVNQYTPYIQAVFGAEPCRRTCYSFSISDSKLSESDVIVSTIFLLNLKESQFGAEEVLALLDIPAIRERLILPLPISNKYVDRVKSQCRFGLKRQNTLNLTWQAGLEPCSFRTYDAGRTRRFESLGLNSNMD